MRRLFKSILGYFDHGLKLWGLGQTLFVLAAGSVSGWLSTFVDFINQFGWMGWWSASLAGGALSAIIALCLSASRLLWAYGVAVFKWGREVDTINPMLSEFTDRRIRIQDLANPMSRRVRRKRFIRCEILGPANLIVLGGHFNAVSFNDCDLVALAPSAKVVNGILLEDCHVIDAEIWNCTIFVTSANVPNIQRMGWEFVTPLPPAVSP